MSKCQRCGRHGLFLKLQNGLCSTCLEQTKSATNRHLIEPTVPSCIKLGTYNFNLHPDIMGLVWFIDGKLKNINTHEPSAISIKLPISMLNHLAIPPYFPDYTTLSPDQRGCYLKTLGDPYNANNDIGYVFLLYYGLERYLLTNKYEHAFNVILKLRKVFNNRSFQNYSFFSLLVTALEKQRKDLCLQLVNNLNLENINFAANLFIYYKFITQEPFTAKELTHYARDFGFTNTHYIKDYPDLFISTLNSILQQDSLLPCRDINISETDKFQVSVYANLTLRTYSTTLFNCIDHPNFKNKGFLFLKQTHDKVKQILKTDRQSYQKHTTQKIDVIYSDPTYYNAISIYHKIKEIEKVCLLNPTKDNLTHLHFQYLLHITEIYKERQQPIALQHVIELCKNDIALVEKYPTMLEKAFGVQSSLKLCVIYEKQKDYDNAILYCRKAISFSPMRDGQRDMFLLDKLEKLIIKRTIKNDNK